MACIDCLTVHNLLSIRSGGGQEGAKENFARSLLAVEHAARARHLALQIAVPFAVADGIKAEKHEEAFEVFRRHVDEMGYAITRTCLCHCECLLFAHGFAVRSAAEIRADVDREFKPLDFEGNPKDSARRVGDGQFIMRLMALKALDAAAFEAEWAVYAHALSVLKVKVEDWERKLPTLRRYQTADDVPTTAAIWPGLPPTAEGLCAPRGIVGG